MQGERGVSITGSKEQWYVSDSNLELTGGSWSYDEPDKIPAGKSLWGRLEFTMSDGSKQYSEAVYRSVISGIKNLTDGINKKITQKIWETDIRNSIDSYDGSTVSTIRNRVNQTESDITGIRTNISNVESTLQTKADGSTVTTLSENLHEISETVDGYSRTISENYATLNDKIDSIKIGGQNLYVESDEVEGYLATNNSGSISDSTANNDVTSDYIAVKPGENYIIQSWATPSTAGESWLAYQFFSSNSGTVSPVGDRVAKYGKTTDSGVETTADGQERLMYSVEVPDNAYYIRVSYRKFDDGYAMVENATKPSEYVVNPKDIQKYTDDAISSAKSEIKQTTDAISLSVSNKVGTNEVISKINMSPETIKISAEKIDIEGKVTFSAFDTATQNTINTASSNASNAISAVNNSIQQTTMHYLATSAASGVTKSTSGWTETIQSMTATKRYLWTYQTITRVGGTSYDTDPVISGVWGDKGETGGKGDTGVSVTKVEQLYRTSSSTTAPAKPTTVVTSTSTTYNTWTLAMPTYNATYPYYYTCTQTTYSDNSHTWTTVARSKAIEDANTTANTANTNASSAVSTANTANTNASTALSTANTASTNASTALTNSQNAQTAASNAQTAADNAQTTANQAVSSAETANDKVNPSLGMKINYSTFTTQDSCECYLHGYSSNIPADIDGYVYWKNRKITVPKMMLNPNTVVPYWATAYIILRLSSGDASTGTLHMVWYKDGWKAHQANLTTSTSNVVTWQWDESTDIALGQFVSPSSDGNIVDAYLYNPPRNASHIITTGSNPYQYSSTAVNWVSNNGTGLLTAKDIIDNWKSDAVTGTTTIHGGYIKTHTIKSKHLATDAIMSNNYKASTNLASPYSLEGTFLDLEYGNFWTPNFGVINVKPANTSVPLGAWFNGTVYANAGHFGDSYIVGNNTIPSYWDIKTRYDKNNQPHAALVGTGSPYVQTANWQLSDNGLTTGIYKSTAASSGDYSYLYDSDNRTIYDMGIKTPTEFVTETDTTTDRYKKSVFYIRKYTLPNGVDSVTPPADDASWTYPFMVDTEGRVFISNLYLGTSGSATAFDSSAFLQKTGGTITGDLTVTGTITGNITGNANYATSAGSAGNVTGTVAVGNGGTGKTSWTANRIIYASSSSALSQLDAGTSGYVLKSNGSNAAPGWVAQNTLSVGKATNDSDGNPINTTYRKLTDNSFDTIDVTDLTAGNLIVTGAGRFTNGLYGDLVGTASEASKVTNSLKIQLNGGTTEGSNQFTYNGSAGKTVNITKASIGLGDVENTKLSTWAGSSNLTTTKVGTLAAAATKGVDTSIQASSTSANLPTSQAVASFVEGKGYVTSSGVTSVRVQATSPVVSSTNTAQTSTLDTTISLANNYGDTKNPYAAKSPHYVLIGPSSGTSTAAPTFRALVADDIPSLSASKVGLGNVTNNKQVKGLSSGTTSGHLVSWGSDGYTVADSGLTKAGLISNITVNDDKITIYKADGSAGVEYTLNITGQIVTKATVLSASNGTAISLGSASQPVYFSNGVPAQANTIPAVTLNGSSTDSPNFYAPIGAGTSGQYLKSNGSGAPTWATFSKSTVGLGNVDNTADANKNVSTAKKFNEAKEIKLTGDVTGSASADGSSGWSIATTVKDDSHEHTMATVRKPILSKTFTSVIASANDQANGNLYFAKILPEKYGTLWSITYKVTATMSGISEGNGLGYEESIVYISGMRDTYASYRTWNNIPNTSYRPYYYHTFYRAKEAGITNNYGHVIGIGLRSSYNPTTTGNARTVTVDILDAEGCTVEFLSAMTKYASLPGTGTTNYSSLSEFDATTNGNTMSGDRNDANYQQRIYYTSSTAAEAIYRYQILLRTKDKKLIPINSNDNKVTVGKTYTTQKFDPLGEIYYYNSGTTIAANGNIGNSVLYRQILADLRYSFDLDNTATYKLTARQPVYLTATLQTDGTAILTELSGSTIGPLSQTLPTSDNGILYIYLGQAYEDTNPYRLELSLNHPVYYYKDGAVREYQPYAHQALTATTATNVSGVSATSDTDRHVWFSHQSSESRRVYNDNFKYNPGTNTLTVGSITGNAASATKATQDGSGNTITSTYLKLSGGTMTGGVTFPNDSSANNDKGIMFAKGSKIGENTSGVLGVYGNSLLYLRPMVGTAYGVLMSYSDISPTTNDEKYPLDLGKTNYPFTNTYSKSVYSKSVVIKNVLTDNSGCRLEFSKDLNCLNFIFD